MISLASCISHESCEVIALLPVLGESGVLKGKEIGKIIRLGADTII